VGEEIARDLARARAHAPFAAGRRGQRQDGGRRAGGCIAIDAGWQCALMAPTEILAEQHFAKLIGWLEPLLAIAASAWPG
jgi:ATP-dependent DNA helicase RecG